MHDAVTFRRLAPGYDLVPDFHLFIAHVRACFVSPALSTQRPDSYLLR